MFCVDFQGVFQVLRPLVYPRLPPLLCFLFLLLSSCLPTLIPCFFALLLFLREIFLVYQHSLFSAVTQAVCSSCYFHPITSLCHILHFTVSHIKTWTMALTVSECCRHQGAFYISWKLWHILWHVYNSGECL